MKRLPRSFYNRDTVAVARELLGKQLARVLPDGTVLAGLIVETEAYLGPQDQAAHTYNNRRSPRNAAMWMQAGTAYVYFTYGLHHCLNLTTLGPDTPQAVLIRALQPTDGLEHMYRNRGQAAKRDTDLCSGPAKLTQALAIDRALDRVDTPASKALYVRQPPTSITKSLQDLSILASPRVGIDYAGAWKDRPLRMSIQDHPHVSRPKPRAV